MKMNLIKIGAFTMIIPIIFAFLLFSCTVSQNSIRKEENYSMTESNKKAVYYEPQKGDIVAYGLNKEAFQKFLRNPSTEAFVGFWVYRKSLLKEGYIEAEGFSVDGTTKLEAKSGVFRVGDWPVHTEFIDFMNNSDNFKQILTKQGIEEKIVSYVIILHDNKKPKWWKQIQPGDGIPQMCIWIHTDMGDYFLEDNPYLPFNKEFINYNFYNLDGYSQMYGGN